LLEIDCSPKADHPITCDHPITRSLYLCHPERAGAHAGAPNTRVFRVVGWSHATASRRTAAMSVPKHAASGGAYEILKDLLPRLTTALQILFAALREIFDESAYDRFLLRTNAARSIASYRAFTHERDASMKKKPRCC
jgi:hypothetical protein